MARREKNAERDRLVKEILAEYTAATRATARYHQKKGLISKSYKLDREIVDMFAEACENIETSQAKS